MTCMPVSTQASAAVEAASPDRLKPAIRFSRPVTVSAAMPITVMVIRRSKTVMRAIPS